jgi:hypothetical protein
MAAIAALTFGCRQASAVVDRLGSSLGSSRIAEMIASLSIGGGSHTHIMYVRTNINDVS